jgi:hypothetical protein
MEQQSQDIWVWVPFEVDKKFDGWRIDQFLTERLTGYSRNKVQKILLDARVQNLLCQALKTHITHTIRHSPRSLEGNLWS